MTVPSVVVTARSLAYYSRLQEVTANNLANASSVGFKADRMSAQSFEAHWPEALMRLDLRQGVVRDTHRALDLALETEGFLVVDTPTGERLTRGGGLEIDGQGFLINRDGHRVLGKEGALHVTGREMVIEPDGTIIVDGAKVDRLRIETVADPMTLEKEGHGRFRATTPTIALHDARLRQGALEDGNVETLEETVEMIRIQRAYAAGVDAMRTLDMVMTTVTTDVGRF